LQESGVREHVESTSRFLEALRYVSVILRPGHRSDKTRGLAEPIFFGRRFGRNDWLGCDRALARDLGQLLGLGECTRYSRHTPRRMPRGGVA
jgi:hypothetical protein